jgi:hypothetical protein
MTLNRVLAVLLAGVPAVMAQMGPGMGPGQNNPANPATPYMQMFQAMGGTPMMGSGMGVGMTDDLAIGSDGTAYVIRSIAPAQTDNGTQSTASWQFELAAISPVDGSASWKLQLPGGRVSRPVLASDGTICLTVDNYQMFYSNFAKGGSMMTAEQAQASDGQLLIISRASGNTSTLVVQTSSDVLSAPRIVSDPAGGYLIYVLGYDMMSWTGTPGSNTSMFAPGEKTLYAYRPDGSLKFSVKLSQAGN